MLCVFHLSGLPPDVFVQVGSGNNGDKVRDHKKVLQQDTKDNVGIFAVYLQVVDGHHVTTGLVIGIVLVLSERHQELALPPTPIDV